MTTNEEMQRKEDELIYTILTSGDPKIVYQYLGKAGLNASIELGAITEDEVVAFYTENKLFEENNNPNIIKLEENNDSFYFDGIYDNKDILNISMEGLDSLLDNITVENVSLVLESMEESLQKFKDSNTLPDMSKDEYLDKIASCILIEESSVSNEEQINKAKELSQYFTSYCSEQYNIPVEEILKDARILIETKEMEKSKNEQEYQQKNKLEILSDIRTSEIENLSSLDFASYVSRFPDFKLPSLDLSNEETISNEKDSEIEKDDIEL